MEAEKILAEITDIETRARREIAAASPAELEAWRVAYLGRKGKVLALTSFLPSLAPADKPEIGRRVNQLKQTLTALYEEKTRHTEQSRRKENLSFPGKRPTPGYLHPLTRVTRELVEIFSALGFGVHTGPDVETDYYNFEALNMPEDHPAKDMWDTFYLDYGQKVLLRTHTSPVQIRFMKKNQPPFRIVAVGRCFRRDALDARHSPVFHQMEGLMVGQDIQFAHLKGVLVHCMHRLFGKDVKVKFNPAYFPFTEPSAEVSISCIICGGKGCATCGQAGWLEILGAGMVHPQVFRNVGYDADGITGFAFGMGIERIAMLKYGIHDIRYFLQNDIRFIEQLGNG